MSRTIAMMKMRLMSRHARFTRSVRSPGIQISIQRKGGRPSRSSRRPARTAREIAISGCMMQRKFIGPSARPIKSLQMRAKMSSMGHHISAISTKNEPPHLCRCKNPIERLISSAQSRFPWLRSMFWNDLNCATFRVFGISGLVDGST